MVDGGDTSSQIKTRLIKKFQSHTQQTMQHKKNYIVIPTQSWDISKISRGQVRKRECFKIPLTYQSQRFSLKNQPLICLFCVLLMRKSNPKNSNSNT